MQNCIYYLLTHKRQTQYINHNTYFKIQIMSCNAKHVIKKQSLQSYTLQNFALTHLILELHYRALVKK